MPSNFEQSGNAEKDAPEFPQHEDCRGRIHMMAMLDFCGEGCFLCSADL
jgi:hypothetical protein